MALLVADGGLRVLVSVGLAEAVPPLSSRTGAVLLEAAGIAVVSPRVGAVVLRVVAGLPEVVVPALSARARPVVLEDVGLPGPAPPLSLREIAPAASVVAAAVRVTVGAVSSIVATREVIACAVVRFNLLSLGPKVPWEDAATLLAGRLVLVPVRWAAGCAGVAAVFGEPPGLGLVLGGVVVVRVVEKSSCGLPLMMPAGRVPLSPGDLAAPRFKILTLWLRRTGTCFDLFASRSRYSAKNTGNVLLLEGLVNVSGAR